MAFDRIPIGKFSLITRLSPKALRLYDERGLLVPEVKDLCTGYRYYSGAQIPRGVSIKTLCSLGFSLCEIDMLLAAKVEQDSVTIPSCSASAGKRYGLKSGGYSRSRRSLQTRLLRWSRST